jgi:hypothetical protein
MNIDDFKKKLASYSPENIHISAHASLRAEMRGISHKEILSNISNPVRLKAFSLESASESKYNCWFEYSNTLGHRYVIVLNGIALVVTVIKIRRRWQKRVESHVKKIQN